MDTGNGRLVKKNKLDKLYKLHITIKNGYRKMRKLDNPFAPGSGTEPPELVGRELILDDAEVAIGKCLKARPSRSQIYYGLRGVGKTVLLRKVSKIAEDHNCIVSDLETPEDKSLADLLTPDIRQALIKLSKKEGAKALLASAFAALQSFASQFRVKVGEIGISVKKPQGLADSGHLEKDVTDLLVTVAEVAQAHHTLIVLALDEMQYLKTHELSALITAIHRINQKRLPLLLFGAGLPQLLGMAGEAKSYAERLFEFIEIGALSEADAKKAIRDPIAAEGAKINPAALGHIISKSQGYPYFVQEWGYRTWNVARKSPITKSDAVTAEAAVIQALDKSFFRVRFDRLTRGEQDYLRAMAELGPGPHKSGSVAKVLRKKANQVGPVRAQVIAKGMAYGGQYGMIHFSVPLFDEFMTRAILRFTAPPPPHRKPRARRKAS